MLNHSTFDSFFRYFYLFFLLKFYYSIYIWVLLHYQPKHTIDDVWWRWRRLLLIWFHFQIQYKHINLTFKRAEHHVRVFCLHFRFMTIQNKRHHWCHCMVLFALWLLSSPVPIQLISILNFSSFFLFCFNNENKTTPLMMFTMCAVGTVQLNHWKKETATTAVHRIKQRVFYLFYRISILLAV